MSSAAMAEEEAPKKKKERPQGTQGRRRAKGNIDIDDYSMSISNDDSYNNISLYPYPLGIAGDRKGI